MALVTSVLMLLPGLAATDFEVLAHAEAAFGRGVGATTPAEARRAFTESAAACEELRQRGYRSPALFLNQGNAALLAGDLSAAILAYRRGLRLEPGHASLRTALAHAREQVARPPGSLGLPPADVLPPGLPRPSPVGFLAAAALAYGTALTAFTRSRMTGSRSWRRTAWVAGAVALALGGWVAFEVWPERYPVVVVARDGVVVRRGNGVSYPPRAEVPLHRGAEGRLRFERGDWVQVEFEGGALGWLPRAAVLVDDS